MQLFITKKMTSTCLKHNSNAPFVHFVFHMIIKMVVKIHCLLNNYFTCMAVLKSKGKGTSFP